MHPTMEDISELTASEIELKILKLNSVYFMTENNDVRQQIILLLDSYKLELETKRTREKIEQERDNGLDDLINVS
tara:strand:+ start:361 stop:585 length:225 start_codon:yes stop_codon:yes gene_type:complete